MVLTKKEYEDLKKIAYTTDEGYLFRNPHNPSKMVKIISSLPWLPIYSKIKLYTIELLLKNHELLKEIKISIPDTPAVIESEQRGYEELCIEGDNLSKVLFDESLSLDTRINYLKQVGTILRDMNKIRRTSYLQNFYYNDIHEDNFIVNKEGIVYGIDIDGCRIADNTPSMALYPSLLKSQLTNESKYQRCDQVCEYTTSIVPDKNLDLYCYIRMIINFMYGRIIDDLNKDNFLEYLDFLEFYGGNQEFLYSLSRIYDDNVENINPDYLLDHIKEIYPYSNINHDKSRCLSKIIR